MAERIDTVVIGAGQAGLASSYYLTQQNQDHVLLERNAVLAAPWRGRWDSFTLVTPNWTLRLPDYPYQGDDPHGFLTRDEVVEYVEDFAATFDPPIRFSVHVTAIEPAAEGQGYVVHTHDGDLRAAHVIVAAGTFQKPRIPACSRDIAETITQLHSKDYRNPSALPDGAVMVVGAGQSGSQIAEELHQSGRKVYLCVSKVRRFPRRYRGKDFAEWADAVGILDRTVDQLPSLQERFEPNPRVSGKDGGHTLNLQQFARDGIVLLGHMEAAQENTVHFAADLYESLAHADKSAAEFKEGVDKYIAQAGLDAPAASTETARRDGYDVEIIRELDLQAEGISTIIWATGYDFDFSWIKLPVLDEDGYPAQKRGVTTQPGLYFVGLHWMHTLKSGLFAGVGDDAAHVVNHLVHH